MERKGLPKRDGYYGSPGYKIDRMSTEIIYKNKKNPLEEQDFKNRKNLQQKIFEYMDKGMTNEEAVDLVMKDKKIVEQFKYLEKNGLDIRQCFINWTKWKVNKKSYSKDSYGDER